MSKQSPGPWTIVDDGVSWSLMGPGEKEVMGFYSDGQGPSPEDARLIAAAPLMLDLLREWAAGLRFVNGVEQPPIPIGTDRHREALAQRLAVTKDFGDRVERLLAEIDAGKASGA